MRPVLLRPPRLASLRRWPVLPVLPAVLLALFGCEESEDVDTDEDGYVDPTDCAPGDPVIHPGAVEACDGQDSDCDGILPPAELDGDLDGVTDCEGDCDDDDPVRLPGADELCDGLDGDCDGVVPDDERDDDADTFSPCGGDCDDTEDAVHPQVADACDGIDTNCDGETAVDDADADGDQWLACGSDCDDQDPTRSPDAEELAGDSIDEDCDGQSPLLCDGAANCIDLGTTADWPAPNCYDLALITRGATEAWIDVDAGGPASPYALRCDALTDGGGWTLVLEVAPDATGHRDDAVVAVEGLGTDEVEGASRLSDELITLLLLAGDVRVDAVDVPMSIVVDGFGFETTPQMGAPTTGTGRSLPGGAEQSAYQCWDDTVAEPDCAVGRWCFGLVGGEHLCLRDDAAAGVLFGGGLWTSGVHGARVWVR